jgi:hypothetical protein
VPAQERLQGWSCGSFPFGRRPYAGSRVRLTEGWRMHNSGRGNISSSWAPTAPEMVLQCPGWQYSSGDGRTGPVLAEELRSTSPMSWRHPCGCGVGVRTLFEGSAVLLRGVWHAAVREWAAQCHRVDTSLPA